MELLEKLKALTSAQGAAGEEGPAGALLAQWCESLGEVKTNRFHNVLCTVRAPKEGEPHLLLQAHLDEIGFMVTGVDANGLLTVTPCGGLDRRLQLASPVTVCTDSGKLPGVVAYTPTVLTGGEGNIPKADSMKIDIGYNKEKTEQLVLPGDRVVSALEPLELENGLLSAKALDNRSGCIAVLRAGELLAAHKEELSCGVTLLFGAMEEVGGHGTKVASFSLMPTHAIVVDVSFAATHDMSGEKYPGELGGGAMIGYSPLLAKEVYNDLLKLAKEKEIPTKKEIMGGFTGTDADGIATTGRGVRTGLISIPQRYMHTPVEVIDPKDVEQIGQLMAAYALNLKEGGEN